MIDAGSIVVKLKAQTTDFLKGMEVSKKELTGLQKGLAGLGVGVAFAAVTAELGKCIAASSEAALNVRKLQAVVSDPADVSTFQDLAGHLSSVTMFSDDAAMAALSMMGKFDLTDKQMGQMLPTVADFAAFMGTDLPTAAATAGKAIASGSAGLRGLGLSFSQAEKDAFDMASQQDRVAILLDKMGSKFGGVAEAAAATGEGGLTQFQNAIGEIEESIGGLIDAPVGAFFGGLATVMNGIATAIGNMGDTTRNVVGVVGLLVTAFGLATGATVAWGIASEFFGGLPKLLTTIATAAGTVASTMATVVMPLIVMAGTLVTIGGMVSRIRSGNYDMNESFIDSIKNNFAAGLGDIKEAFKGVFDAPSDSADKLAKGLAALDDTARKKAGQMATEMEIELAPIVDMRKPGEEAGARALNASAPMPIPDTVEMLGDLDVEVVDTGEALTDLDIALDEMKSVGLQVVGNMGQAGATLASMAGSLAKGDLIGAAVSLGIDLLTRTKSFKKLSESLESIFNSLSGALEPVVAALVPFLDIIALLAPIFIALNPGLAILSAVVKSIGEGLLEVFRWIGGFWNSMIDWVADFISKIPVIGDDLEEWVRSAKMDLEAKHHKEDKEDEKLGDASQKATEQILNAPEGFKVAAARFKAITPQDMSTGAGGWFAGGVVRNTAVNNTSAPINIQTLAINTPNPQAVGDAIQAAAKREAFLRTGSTVTGESARSSWGA